MFVGEPDANRVVDYERDLGLVYDEGASAPSRYRPMVIRRIANGVPVARFSIASKSTAERDRSAAGEMDLIWSIHGGASFANLYPEAAELVREAMLAYHTY